MPLGNILRFSKTENNFFHHRLIDEDKNLFERFQFIRDY